MIQHPRNRQKPSVSEYRHPIPRRRLHPVGPAYWWDESVDAPFQRSAANQRAIMNQLCTLPGEAPFIAAWVAVRGAYEMLLHVSPGLVMRLDEAQPRHVPLTEAVTAMDDFVMHNERVDPDIADLSMALRRGFGAPGASEPRFPDTGETLEQESPLGLVLWSLWIMMGDRWFSAAQDTPIDVLYEMRDTGARQDPRRSFETGFTGMECRELAGAVELALDAVAQMRVTRAAFDDDEPELTYRDTVARWWAAVERLFPFQYMTKSRFLGKVAKAPHVSVVGNRVYEGSRDEPPGPGEYIAYHASDRPERIEGFVNPEIGFHFAANPGLAINAALKGGRRQPTVHPYRLLLMNPIEISNQPNGFTAFRLLDDLLERGVLTPEEHEVAMDAYDELEATVPFEIDEAAAELIQNLMKQKGVDSFVHWNEFDAGLNIFGTGLDVEPDWSFIVFYPHQIQRA